MRGDTRRFLFSTGKIVPSAHQATHSPANGSTRTLSTGSAGAAAAAMELVSDANQIRRSFTADSGGHATAQDLPFGLYRLTTAHAAFAPNVQTVEIRSEVPSLIKVTLGLASVQTQVQVNARETLIDPNRTATVAAIGSQMIREELPSQPGRGLLNLVDSLPGWFFEANGVLHPRESEYQVQFIVDGLLLTENRSPAFAAPFQAEESDLVQMRTAGYPAKYGRKLGGVVEIHHSETCATRFARATRSRRRQLRERGRRYRSHL